jgi:hypothetical protein
MNLQMDGTEHMAILQSWSSLMANPIAGDQLHHASTVVLISAAPLFDLPTTVFAPVAHFVMCL